jgi:hypothetical protein
MCPGLALQMISRAAQLGPEFGHPPCMKRNSQWMTMTALLGAALLLAPGFATAQNDQSNSAKQDMKDAGHDTKAGAKDAGKGVKKGTKSTYHAGKKDTTKAWHKTKNTTKGAVKGGKEGAKDPQ